MKPKIVVQQEGQIRESFQTATEKTSRVTEKVHVPEKPPELPVSDELFQHTDILLQYGVRSYSRFVFPFWARSSWPIRPLYLVPLAIGVALLQSSLYDVPGGFKAVMFDRFSGVKDQVWFHPLSLWNAGGLKV